MVEFDVSFDITSGQVGDTTLTTAQLAIHKHTATTTVSGSRVNTGSTGGGFAADEGGYTNFSSATASTSISNTGGDEAHTHSLVGASAGGTMTSDFAVKYANMIICIKD